MMNRAITVQSFIVVSLVAVATCGSVDWLQKKEGAFIFYRGDDYVINCSLSDPTMNVTLWHSKEKEEKYRLVIPDGQHIRQSHQIFKILHITNEDIGRYQCRAENVTAFAVLVVHLTHEGMSKPEPRIRYYKNRVKYGRDVQLLCSANAWVDITWYKSKQNGTRKEWKMLDSAQTGLSHRRTKQVLTIKSFNVSDNGVYICEIRRRSTKYVKHKEVYLSIGGFQKPSFTKFEESHLTGSANRSYLDFYYSVAGIPPPSIIWHRVNDDMGEVVIGTCGSECTVEIGDYGVTRGHFYSTHTVLFPRDNATFKCVISNSLGTESKTFTLNVTAKPKIVTTNDDEVTYIHVYKDSHSTELVCEANGNPNMIEFKWRAQLTDSTTNPEPNNSKWFSIEENDKKFSIVSSEGKSTLFLKQSNLHFFYQCVASNTIGEDQRVWAVIPVTGSKPLKAEQKMVEVDEGENAQLSCKVEKYTSNKIEWKYNDSVVQLSPRMSVKNSTTNGTVYNTLYIKKVNVTDAGKYTCFGELNGGITNAKIQLIVRELKAPVVSLKKLTKEKGSSFIVQCSVSGHPKPRITWKKDGKGFPDIRSIDGKGDCKDRFPGIYEDKNHANVLIFCKSNYEKHLGQFSCTARNKLGNDTVAAFINVTGPPEIAKFKPGLTLELGEAFYLKCEASGNPKPRVWWMKKNEKTSKFEVVEEKETLYFETVDESNIGSYRCCAQNGFDLVTKNITLSAATVSATVSNPPNHSKKYTIVIGCVSFFIVAIVIIVAIVLYKRKKIYGGFYILTLPPLPDYIKKLDPHTPITEQTNKLPYDAEWEFPRNRLKFSRELGAGAFGKVFLADAMGIVAFDPRNSTKRRSSRRRFGGSVRRNHYVNNNKMTKVAVKTLKEDSGETEYKDLLSELKILIHVGEHKNIVNLLGACTKGLESELWVIIEYCSNGNLLQFLRNRRDIYETEWKGVSKDPNMQLTMTDLVIAAYQIARGMEFLASRMCIHRDLATRNILVMDNYVIKIADFGLARDVGQDSQYVKTSNGLLPIKWMAIEAIIQRLFTEKSDVWSFGIVLWELFTLGGTPYPNISPNEVAEFLARGHRMEPPHACPDEMSTLMMKCWHEDKDCRPTFKELVEFLDKIIELHTSSEGGCGYLEVQGEVPMNEYLSPSEVKSPHMDPFECNSPLPPIPSPGQDERDSLLLRDQNARGKKFHFDKALRNKATRQDSEIEKIQKDRTPEMIKLPDIQCHQGKDLDGYIDTSLTGKEKERIERDLDKDRDSSEEPQQLGDYAYWKNSIV